MYLAIQIRPEVKARRTGTITQSSFKNGLCLSILIFFSGCAAVDLENKKYIVGGAMPNEETISKRAINTTLIPLSVNNDIYGTFYDLDGDFEHEYAFGKLKCGGDILTYAASEMSTKRYFVDNKDEDGNAKPDGIESCTPSVGQVEARNKELFSVL